MVRADRGEGPWRKTKNLRNERPHNDERRETHHSSVIRHSKQKYFFIQDRLSYSDHRIIIDTFKKKNMIAIRTSAMRASCCRRTTTVVRRVSSSSSSHTTAAAAATRTTKRRTSVTSATTKTASPQRTSSTPSSSLRRMHTRAIVERGGILQTTQMLRDVMNRMGGAELAITEGDDDDGT